MYKQSIGVLGGFGGFATLEFYKNFLQIFMTDNERNYPHIFFDNNFTMPSRTRALLYGEKTDEIVDALVCSIRHLLDYDVTYIILVCGTAHYFLDDVISRIPEAKEKILNIIEVTSEKIISDNNRKTFIIAAEGTLEKKLYDKYMNKYGIECVSPTNKEYSEIRKFIEYVKKNQLRECVIEEFIDFIQNRGTDNIVLGCTEFPALLDYCTANGDENQIKFLKTFHFYDPMNLVLEKLKGIII